MKNKTRNPRERRMEQKDMDELREAFMRHNAGVCASLLGKMRLTSNISDFGLEETFSDCYVDKRTMVNEYIEEAKRIGVMEKDCKRDLFEGENKIKGRETRDLCLEVLKEERVGLMGAKSLCQLHEYVKRTLDSVAEFFYAGSDVARLWEEGREIGVLKPCYYKFSSGPPLVPELKELDDAIAETSKIMRQRVARLYGGFFNHCMPLLGFEGDDRGARRQIEENPREYGALIPERVFFRLDE